MNRSKLAFALKLGVLASTVFALSLTPVFAGGCLEPGGQWPLGPVHSVATSGNLAVYSQSVTIEIADVSDPSNPVVLGATEIEGIPYVIAVSGSLAFVAAYDDGLFIFDVTDPLAPQWITHFQNTSVKWTGWDLEIVGDILYVAFERATVAYNLSDPQSPALIGRHFAPGISTGIDVAGDRAFVAAGNGGIASVGCTECADAIFADGFEEWFWYDPWSQTTP